MKITRENRIENECNMTNLDVVTSFVICCCGWFNILVFWSIQNAFSRSLSSIVTLYNDNQKEPLNAPIVENKAPD